jgi:hypothetical protein
MASRDLFVIKLILPALLLWQLSFVSSAYAKVHIPAAGSGATSDTNPASSSNTEDTEITQLEQKLFEHDYPTDSMSQRLERLEKMVFGKVNNGSDAQRLDILKTATTNSALESSSSSAPVSAAKSTDSHHRHTADTQGETTDESADSEGSNSEQPGDSTQYPAVTAIEKRLLGKDYSSDPISKRLDRLELKQFGKISNSDDLSERMDHLKQATGIDIAKQPPSGSDWVDEDELSFTDAQGVGKITPFTPDAVENGANINNFIGNYMQGNNQGLGAGGGSSGSSVPHSTPIVAQPRMGLSQEVSSLEKEVFGKTYTKDSLPARVNRLEAAIFPDEKIAADKSLPDRVSRLLAVVPLSDGKDSQYDGNTSGNPGQGQSGSSKHGLSKLLSNMLGFTGAYSGSGSGNMSVDPQTGLLYNPSTGQLIDPSTGAVIGQRMGGAMSGVTPWGFGSGLSPFGTMPYGGFGSMGGMGFGMGRMGMGGFGGLWP